MGSGHEPSDELATQIQDHVKSTTAPYKYPRHVEFVDELPRRCQARSGGSSCANANARRTLDEHEITSGALADNPLGDPVDRPLWTLNPPHVAPGTCAAGAAYFRFIWFATYSAANRPVSAPPFMKPYHRSLKCSPANTRLRNATLSSPSIQKYPPYVVSAPGGKLT